MPDGPRKIRFGIFEADLAAGELRRNGSKVKLQDQPFQVLAALLEKPGEVVTKEELRKRIWDEDTYVDFDRSLATAVNRVRTVLGDSATCPRFIETVPKRGYRYLAESPSPPPRNNGGEPSNGTGSGRKTVTPAIGVSLGAIAAVALAWWFLHPAPPSQWSEPRRITSAPGLTFQPTISADGTLIAYASDRAGKGDLDIWVQQIGSEPVQITDDPADESEPHLSPDGKQVAFRSERNGGGIYIRPTIGGHARLLAPGGRRPRFSPDGRRIAYHTGRHSSPGSLTVLMGDESYIIDATGGEPVPLNLSNSRTADPVWSPDSSRLLIRTRPLGGPRYEHYAWRVFSGDGREIGPSGAFAKIRASPAANRLHVYRPEHWSPDGFVYFTSGDEDSVDLWRIEVDPKSGRADGDPERVLAGTGSYLGPAIAGDGALAFADIRSEADIWSLGIDPATGLPAQVDPIQLTDAEGFDGLPSVSHDGSRIAFVSERTGERATWLLDLQKHEERLLLEEAGWPQITESGERVAAGAESMVLVSVDGAVQHKPSLGIPYGWSHDESLVLFNRLHKGSRAIFVYEPGTDRTSELLLERDTGLYQAQFSPDGRWICWMKGRSGDIWIAPFPGLRPIPEIGRVPISTGDDYSDKPRWSPDGSLLYYTSDRDGHICIYAQPLDPRSKQPRGDPLEVYHSHDVRLSMSNVGSIWLEIDVARDKLVFGMAELTGNIWMLEPATE